MEDKHSKTEDATPKRIRDAREKGQVAKSADLNIGVSLIIFTGLLMPIWSFLFKNFYYYLINYFKQDFNIELTNSFLSTLGLRTILLFLTLMLPVALIAILIGVLSNLVQVGFLFTASTLKPDVKKLNPIQGFKNIFSKKSMKNLVKNILKLVLVFYMMYKNLIENKDFILASGNIELENLFFYFIQFLRDITMNIVILVFVLGVVDYIFERKEHKDNLKMTKQEVKEEYKLMEGNQEVKAARRQRQKELAMGRMMEDVTGATVIVTNPTHLAIAIRYDSEIDEVPVILGKGAGYIAKK